jgi:hypothetical protein
MIPMGTCLELSELGFEKVNLPEGFVGAFHEERGFPLGGVLGIGWEIGEELVVKTYAGHLVIL